MHKEHRRWIETSNVLNEKFGFIEFHEINNIYEIDRKYTKVEKCLMCIFKMRYLSFCSDARLLIAYLRFRQIKCWHLCRWSVWLCAAQQTATDMRANI